MSTSRKRPTDLLERDKTVGTKPLPVKRRFVAKKRDKSWWVYDTVRGSWPVQIAGAGSVSLAFSDEESCLVEADRCNREATN